jgi:hypothetical protein
MWSTVGLPEQECITWVEKSESMQQFRTRLFSRVVPVIRDIGLWGPKVHDAYAKMNLLGFANVDTDALLTADQQVAEEFDARRQVAEVIHG